MPLLRRPRAKDRPRGSAEAPRVYAGKRLLRSTADRKIGDVCGGLAEYFGLYWPLATLEPSSSTS